MSKAFAFFVVACFSVAVHAQGDPAFLTKEQASDVLGGKAFTFARPDGAKIRWEFKTDGTVYANNRSSTRKDAGDWTSQDNGAVCIKWRGGSNDSCSSYFLKDGQLMRTGGRSEDSVAKAVAMTPD